MTEHEHLPTDQEIAPAVPQRRPGRELAAARERAGISFETMAEGLRLPKRQLQALEADDYASLPPPAYVRGYIRAYARQVGLDGDDIVALFDADHGDLQDPDLHPATPAGPVVGRSGLPIGLAVIALVVVAGIGGWWWQGRPADSGPAGGSAPAAEDGGPATADAGAADGGPAGDAAAGGGAAPGAGAGQGTPAPVPGAGDEPAQDSRVAAATDATDADATDADATDATGATDAASAPEPGPAATASPEPAATAGQAAGAGDTEDGAAADATAAATAVAGADEPGVTQDEAGATGVGDTTQAAADTGAGDTPPDAAAAQAAGGGTQEQAPPAPGAGGQETADTQVAEAGEQDGADAEEGEVTQHASPSSTSSPDEAATPAAAYGPDTLVLRVDGRSWMEVYDAGDRELVYTLYFGSEPIRLQGWAPFDVFLGNSPAVTVMFNGQEVAKSAFTRSDNTARFLVDADGARRR